MARASSLIDLVQAEAFVFFYSFLLYLFLYDSFVLNSLPQRHAASGVNLLLSALRS